MASINPTDIVGKVVQDSNNEISEKKNKQKETNGPNEGKTRSSSTRLTTVPSSDNSDNANEAAMTPKEQPNEDVKNEGRSKRSVDDERDDDSNNSKSNGKQRQHSSSVVVDAKRARLSESVEEKKAAVVVDKAVELGFKAGDRLEVEWEVGTDDDNNNNDDKTTRHWGATLLEHDGRTKEGFAIRVVDYDPYPEGGFPERSKEDVVFLTEYLMIDAESGAELHFRREGADEIVDFGEDDLNEMLATTLSKKSEAWSKLSAAQQAQMADIISTGKERLLHAIQSRWDERPGRVITAEEMPDILKQAFEGM